MQLTLWTYEGPTHVGAMRIATAMRGLHYVLHAPQGDTYADLLFTMIERRDRRPPVTYTTFQARDLGSDTAELFKNAAREAYERFQPQAMIVGASCTAELIQDDPGGLARALDLPIPVVPLELPSYQRKENWGAAETLYQLVRTLAAPSQKGPSAPAAARESGRRPRCNILGPTALGFRHRDDLREVKQLLEVLGVDVNVTAPLDATPADLRAAAGRRFQRRAVSGDRVDDGPLARAHLPAAGRPPWCRSASAPPARSSTKWRRWPASTRRAAHAALGARAAWYSRSVDSTYLTGKRVFIFGDATHAVAAARVARDELGFVVVGLGTYSREFAREIRAGRDRTRRRAADHRRLPRGRESAIAAAHPDLVLGTQMERHVAKRLGVPCAVISAPVHVQDFPARYSPQMGFEGANVLFDTWVHPLMMGLEEHLLGMFREDFEFHDDAAPSHLGHGHAAARTPAAPTPATAGGDAPRPPAPRVSRSGRTDAEKELGRIPFFVRGKARRNTEQFAAGRGVSTITVETLYDAKAHFGR